MAKLNVKLETMNLVIRTSKFFILITVFIIINNGCMVGPNLQKPNTVVPPEWDIEENEVVNHCAVHDCLWWKILDDPILNNLINIAHDQNLDLLTAGLRVYEARATLGIAVGNLYPQEQFLFGDFRTFRESVFSPDRFFNELSVGFDAVWELDLWGKYRRGVQAAGANLLATIANYDDAMVAITAEVARVYVLIRSFQERIALAKKNAEIQKRVLDLTIVLYEGGTESELDAQQAATVHYSTQSLIPRFERSLNQARNALSVLLNVPTPALDKMLQDYAPIPKPPREIAVGIPASLLRRRPDIRLAEYQALSQCALIGVAKSELYPSFSLFGSVGWAGTDAGAATLGNFFSGDNYTYEFGPSMNWNIFNYGRIKNQVRVQDARFEQLLARYQNTVIQAVSEVQDATVAFLKSVEESEYLKKSVESAERSLNISVEQYIEGLATYQRVLDSTRSLTVQQDQYVQASTDAIVNLIATYKALGGGWETRCLNPFVSQTIKCKMEQRTDWGKLLKHDTEQSEGCRSMKNQIRAPDW